MAPQEPGDLFGPADLRQLRKQGITLEEARRQIERLEGPPGHAELDRPCTPGDGIDTIPESEVEPLTRLHQEAARDGRCLTFVPASGAASRMFHSLLHYGTQDCPISRKKLEADAAAGKKEAVEVLAFLEGIPRFAFLDDSRRAAAGQGDELEELLRLAMDYARLPKGLLKFHAYPDRSRTPFEEHLVEAAEMLKDARGKCRLHFTVSPAHLEPFRSLLEQVRDRYEKVHHVAYEVGFSVQKPSTDTLALDMEGQPFRLDDGTLLFRPAGHGALMENLSDLEADIVLIKNIDNVAPDRLKKATYTWSKLLVGRLSSIQNQVFDLLRRLEDQPADTGAAAEATSLVRDTFHLECSERRQSLIRRLHRPVRVCGMVKSTGEPGGGPFWVRGKDGALSMQIVEDSQVDPDSGQQQGLLARSTHFNPVYLVCGVRDHHGQPYDLKQYIDPDAAMVTRKATGGRKLSALERPGLWNGAMAGWNTIFIEVPGEVFHPVKTVNDLLRAEHQPGGED